MLDLSWLISSRSCHEMLEMPLPLCCACMHHLSPSTHPFLWLGPRGFSPLQSLVGLSVETQLFELLILSLYLMFLRLDVVQSLLRYEVLNSRLTIIIIEIDVLDPRSHLCVALTVASKDPIQLFCPRESKLCLINSTVPIDPPPLSLEPRS